MEYTNNSNHNYHSGVIITQTNPQVALTAAVSYAGQVKSTNWRDNANAMLAWLDEHTNVEGS